MGREKRKRGIAVAGTWTPLGLTFLRSRACAELSTHAAKLLIDLLSMLGPNATRNGDLSIAPRVMKVRGWSGRETLRMAVFELLEHGLLAQTRQGTRLDCSLFALTLFPIDCDVDKLDAGAVGSYTSRDWEKGGLNAPTKEHPATWRQVRKTVSVTPPRDKVPENCPATGQTQSGKASKHGTLSRYGTNPPVLTVAPVPPRGTYLDKPSMGSEAKAQAPAPAPQQPSAPATAPGKSIAERVLDALRDGKPWTAEDLRAVGIHNAGSAVSHLRLSWGCAIDNVKVKGEPVAYVLKSAPEHLAFRADPNGKRRLCSRDSIGNPASHLSTPVDTEIATAPENAPDAVLTDADRRDSI